MKRSVIAVLFFITILFNTEALKNYMGTEIQKCINCLCHARSGCWSRFNCARYSVSFEYWKAAGSPVVDNYDDRNSEESYHKCLGDENCIVATIVLYTERYDELDCNCDGVFDCKDRFAIHLFNSSCANPNFTQTYATRFNECAASIGVKEMIAKEGSETCAVEIY